MKIELRERRTTPMWLVSDQSAVAYYRATVPSRMTGGAVCNSIRASVDGGAVESTYLTPAFLTRIRNCSELTLYGMGTPTVLPLRDFLNPEAEPFLNAARSLSGIMFDVDDPLGKTAFDVEVWVDDITRQFLLAAVTGNTAEIQNMLPAKMNICQMIHVAQRVLGGKLLTPEGLVLLHDGVKAALTSGMSGIGSPETGKSGVSGNIHLMPELIAGTVPLVDSLKGIAPESNVRVAENAVDPANFQAPKRHDDGVVRIGYSSSSSHKPDAALIMPALRKCAQMPNVEVWFFGWHPQWSYDLVIDRPKTIEFDGLVYRHGGYHNTLKFFRAQSILDVALAPLQDTLQNRCRASSKWLECSMNSIPMVLQDAAPYACVEHGVTAFKARTAEEFTAYAVQLCKDAGLRKRIGNAAHDYVMEHHTVAACAEQWRAAVGC